MNTDSENKISGNEDKNPSGSRSESPFLAQASSRPWHIAAYDSDELEINDQQEGHIAFLNNSRTGEANAELIVLAVNSYEASQRRIEALERALGELCGFLNVTPLRLNEGDSMTLSMLTDAARAALKESDD